MPHTILSVGGDDSRRDATNQALRLSGFEVVEAVSAAEALKLASQLQPSLILLGAPPAGAEEPGEARRRFKADPRTARIPALHIHGEGESGRHCREGLECGADACLRAPVAQETLAAVAAALIQAGAAGREGATASRPQGGLHAQSHAILERMRGSVCWFDKDFRFTDLNAAAERLTGRSRDALLGKCLWGVFPDAIGTNLEREFRLAAGRREPCTFEYHSPRLKNWLEVRAWPAEDGGIAMIALDITDRKQAERALAESEEKFAKTFQLNAAAMALTRLSDGLILEVNERWAEISGFSREEIVGRSTSEIGLWKDPAERARAMRDLETHGSFRARECQFVRENGETWTALVSCEVISLQGARTILSSATDITEREMAEERLRQSRKLESAGALAAGVAHDFNNLLVSVIGNASLAQEFLPPDNPAAVLLDGIVKAGEQAAHLTRQMLAYSGKGRFLVETVNLSDLIPEAIALIQPSIPNTIAVRLDLAADLPQIEADRVQVRQVFLNLMLNAAEAIGADAGTISVRASVREVDEHYIRRHPETAGLPHGPYVCLEVRDTGCGMDEATKSRIFDPFFSTKFTGRGLGLAAAGGILRAHKGAIAVSSAPGEGACFTALFPAAGGLAPGG